MNNDLKIGDKVAVLDDAIDGVVTKINQGVITIHTTDDFVIEFKAEELVKINKDSLTNLFSSKSASQVISEKTEPKKRSFVKEKKSRKDDFVLEVDLHIEKLVPTVKAMSNYDILNIQIDTAKGQLDFAIKNRMQKIVFIHGVGEGVLKSELEFLLQRYEQVTFQEASFQKYGFGATEVYIKQSSF
ncbi:DNA mismatch repair protein MutS [Flavobacterium sp. 9AF]|uniref:Smr/MutS family protein n=1 Tax=Flavobacterium sp. 9AF TaxID=2653142 RepID=UPI0012F30612|nr:Smr/MutS family protein [Flavobacterium sp. 9AF]VXB74577.1 DNA mismatch repair protein MutS [Flavobacterium sp. 9AF]